MVLLVFSRTVDAFLSGEAKNDALGSHHHSIVNPSATPSTTPATAVALPLSQLVLLLILLLLLHSLLVLVLVLLRLLFHNLRDNFGLAQAKLFDAYFKFSLLCLAIAGFTAAALVSTSSDVDGGAKLGTAPFLVALTTVVLNLVFFSPQTTITMMERRRVCRELGVERTSADPRVRNLRTMLFVYMCTFAAGGVLARPCLHLFLTTILDTTLPPPSKTSVGRARSHHCEELR